MWKDWGKEIRVQKDTARESETYSLITSASSNAAGGDSQGPREFQEATASSWVNF